MSRYIQLASALASQEFPGAFRGNLTGALAAIAVPVAMLATYAFVFSTLIPVRIKPGQSTAEYALFLTSGLVVWNLAADVVTRSPRLFSQAGHYVQRARFPISVLVVAPCLASFYRSLPWLVAFALAHLWLLGALPWTLIAAPLVLLCVMVIALGLALGLASVGAVVRDLGDVVPPLMSLAFFVSPILYPATKLQEMSDWILLINPFSSSIRSMHLLLIDGVWPPLAIIGQLVLAMVVSVTFGLCLYHVVRDSLQDLV